jgi:NADPH:quinone reductase
MTSGRLVETPVPVEHPAIEMMRAARCVEYGADLVVADVPSPAAGSGQALIAVRAAAVNFPDVLVTRNEYQISVPTPFTAGSELAGEVIAVGPGVDPGWLRRRVMASSMTGAFADRVVCAAAGLKLVPDGLGFVAAAALWVSYGTAFHALHTIGQARRDDWVVVLGAAGGVGLACVDIAARQGMRVIAAASSLERVALARRYGAQEGIAYGEEDLKTGIKRITGRGADLVVDPVGGSLAEAALRAVRWGGRFVTVGYASGEIPRIPLNLVLLKGPVVRGFELRTIEGFVPGATATAEQELARLVGTGLRPHIGRVYPLHQAADAMRDLTERRAVGKVVLDVEAS